MYCIRWNARAVGILEEIYKETIKQELKVQISKNRPK